MECVDINTFGVFGDKAMSTFVNFCRTVLYRGEADVKQSGMLLEGAPVDWESSAGSKLAHLLSPSTQSTNFRIAHEVEHLKNFDLLPSILMPPIVLVFGYHFATLLPKCRQLMNQVIKRFIISLFYFFQLHFINAI